MRQIRIMHAIIIGEFHIALRRECLGIFDAFAATEPAKCERHIRTNRQHHRSIQAGRFAVETASLG